MDILYYLLLSHFFADYLFQPNWLACFKARAFMGTLIHGAIVGLTMMAALIPYLYCPDVRYSVAALTLLHVIIDHGKGRFIVSHPEIDGRLVYTLDQLLHIGLIVLLTFFAIGPVAPQAIPASVADWYFNPWFLAYLLALVLFTYFYDVTRHIFSRHGDILEYERDYYGISLRAGVVTLVFVIGFALTR